MSAVTLNTSELESGTWKGTAGAGHVIDKSVALSPRNMAAITPVTITGTSAQSAAIAATQVDLLATAACWVAFGTNPTATTSSYPLAANFPVRLGLVSGDKIAVIGTSGTLSIGPVGAL